MDSYNRSARDGSNFRTHFVGHTGGGAGDNLGRAVVITANDGGAAWTPDEGNTWFSLPGVSGYWAVAFASPKAGWLVGTDGRRSHCKDQLLATVLRMANARRSMPNTATVGRTASIHRESFEKIAQPSASIRVSKSFLLVTPVTWSRSWPFLKKSRAGIARILYLNERL